MNRQVAGRIERWAQRQWPDRSVWAERKGRSWVIVVHSKRTGETIVLTEDIYWQYRRQGK